MTCISCTLIIAPWLNKGPSIRCCRRVDKKLGNQQCFFFFGGGLKRWLVWNMWFWLLLASCFFSHYSWNLHLNNNWSLESATTFPLSWHLTWQQMLAADGPWQPLFMASWAGPRRFAKIFIPLRFCTTMVLLTRLEGGFMRMKTGSSWFPGEFDFRLEAFTATALIMRITTSQITRKSGSLIHNYVCMHTYMHTCIHAYMHTYILYIPATRLSSILVGEPSRTRSFPNKTRVIWVPDM